MSPAGSSRHVCKPLTADRFADIAWRDAEDLCNRKIGAHTVGLGCNKSIIHHGGNSLWHF